MFVVMMLVMMLAMFIWPVLLVVGIVLLVRWLKERGNGAGDQALRTLRERLARGEIDEAEYQTRRRVLEAGAER